MPVFDIDHQGLFFTRNERVHKQNKECVHKFLHEHHTIECALSDVHLKKKSQADVL